MYRIRAFWAPDDHQACVGFAEGHANVLREIGVKVTSGSDDWIDDPFVYVLVAEDPDNDEIVGGARIHIAHQGAELPMQSAIARVDPKIHDVVAAYAAEGTCEVCGLWNSRKVSGKGLGISFLTRAAAAISEQIDVGSMFALVAKHTLKMSREKGMLPVTNVGDNGKFNYPRLNLVATAVVLKDPKTFAYASPQERAIIKSLKEEPEQIRMEYWPRGDFELEYLLKLKSPDWRTLNKVNNQTHELRKTL
ncbi:MAG TPA: hypothetical protein DDX92_05655 [Flavobacteriales bacterium]|jgi:hypothetical protein|nr:hypothetical protein [Flavobacteriales bacterium]